MTALTTIANVKKWLGIPDSQTNDDALLNNLIDAASVYLQDVLSRQLLSTDYTNEIHNGNGSNSLVLIQTPINTINSIVVTDFVTGLTTTFTNSDCVIAGRTIYLKSGKVFPKGKANISANYNAGYATVPKSLEQAVWEMVGYKYREKDRIGHVSKSLGPETVTFDIKDLPASVRTIINQNQRVIPV